MADGRTTLWWAVAAGLLAVLAGPGPGLAQTTLRGDVGADLESVYFQNQLDETTDPYAVRRALSDQFLRLQLLGPLYKAPLGSY